MDNGETRIRKADRARALQEDDVLVEVLESARTSFTQQSIHGDTVDDRETARAGVLAIEAVVRELQKLVDAGEVARESIRRAQ